LFILPALVLMLSAVPAHDTPGVDRMLAKADLAFERNEGQFDSKVKFLARGQGYGLFLTRDEAILRFTTPKSDTIRMKFLGQKGNVPVSGLDELAGTTNYLLGNRATQSNIHSYKKVRYSEIYPGVDVEYHGNGRLLEYDFIVQPGSNPHKIRIGFSGSRGVSINDSGDLVLKTAGDPIVQKKPHVYQVVDGQEQTVDAGYVISGNHVGFKIAAYDKTKPLVIDPVLVYSTFFGGTGSEIGYGIAVDLTGAVYVAGSTTSTDFPIQSAVQPAYGTGSTDAFVFKLDPTANQIVYSTFIGGSGTDEAHSIAVDAGGNAYITGFTQSNDFPVVNAIQKTRAGQQEAYVLKLNSSGSGIVFSTYLGGSADDRGFGIALDAANNVYVTGITASSNFPTLNPYQRNNAGGFADGFVTKISPAGTLVYSTYVGGIGNDNPLGIAVDGVGAAYVTGWTTSVNFPRVNAFQTNFGGLTTPIGTDDVFVFKLNPAGNGLDYSTYVGGTGSDEATRIAVDSSGSAYVTGLTASLDFPTVAPYQALLSNAGACITGAVANPAACLDAFVFKLAPDGKSLVFSTYFGGFQTDSGTGIAVDASGAVYISGFTTSFDLPSANQIQSAIGGDRDAFIAKFNPAGNVLVFSTFLGSTGTESATGLAVDPAGNVYVVGLTTSSDFTTANAVQATEAGGQDIFIAKVNVSDIVSSSQFQIAPQGVSSVVTKGTRTDSVFGYAVAQPTAPNTSLTGLALIDRVAGDQLVSEVGIPSTPFVQIGRLFVDVTSTGRSVLSIANPGDTDANVDFYYTDSTGATNQFMNTTVKAHQHFSKFVTDDPLNIVAPGTLNFTASVPVVATAFFTLTNESNDFLISSSPIVDPIAHTAAVGSKTVTIPELAEGAGWKNDIILVNTSEDRMNGEVRFFGQGSGDQPGPPTEVGIAPDNTAVTALEFDIPSRSFQKISTSGSATISEVPFNLGQGTSVRTSNGGPFQVTGFASADSWDPNARLNGVQIFEYRQLGITQSQAGVIAPALRQYGRFFAELTDKIHPFVAFANPNSVDVNVDIYLTDDGGNSTGIVSVNVPPGGEYVQFLSEAPVSLPTSSSRTVNFSASSPVFVDALRFFTNERGDSLLSAIPIADPTTPIDQQLTIPEFADGGNWKTQVVLVNNTDEEMHGEVHFLSQGSSTDAPQPVVVGTDNGDNSAFEYDILPRSFFRLQTNGLMDSTSVGSVRIVPFVGSHTPFGHVLLSYFAFDREATFSTGSPVGTTIFDTAIEGQLPRTQMRFYAESQGDFDGSKARSTRTTMAIANPSNAPATVRIDVTALDGTALGVSSPISIPAGGQIAAFLNQLSGLESVPVGFQGVARLTVLSGSGVTAASFRLFRNERSELLATTTGPLNENAGMPGHLVFPYLTDSTGYTTQFVLINPPGTQTGSGILRYWAVDATPLQVDALKLGSIQVVPFQGFATPHTHVVMNHTDGGVLTSIIGVEGQIPAKTLRMFADAQGDFDPGTARSTRSGVALANPASAPVSVTFQMRSLDGTLLRTSQPLVVPANGQVSLALNSIPGFESLAAPFEGVLTVTSNSNQGITAAGFHLVNNERGNILFTAIGPLKEDAGATQQVVFPHIAEGGGYTTQFVVISGDQANTGVLSFFSEDGNPLNLTLAPR
jgi:Beta-propeller repeat